MDSNLEIISPLSFSKQRKFGQVFLVQDINNRQKYVLKRAKIHSISKTALSQLQNESSFSFSHPQLPKVFKSIETAEHFSMLLSYKNGITLSDFWKIVPKKLRLTITKLWIQKLIELLNFLHVQNIYHCDIKPSNIIIEQHNSSLTDFDLHLIDFGLAFNKKNNLNNNNATIFPLGFAPPEQILKRYNLINPSSDFFSIGITVFYLWTNKLPLTHPNPLIFTNLQLAHPLPYNSVMNKQLNTWITKVCYKPKWTTAPNLMTKLQVDKILIDSFEKRYVNSNELLHELQEI